MKSLSWLCSALLAVSVTCILTLLALPWLLRGHAYQLRQVKARFETPAEQYELAARATQARQPVFNALYDPLQNRLIDAYVPPRASFAYFLLRVVNHGEALASKEDFLPAPPAPMAFEFIELNSPEPFSLAQCEACRLRWMALFGGAALAALGGVLILRRQHIARALSPARQN